MMMIRLQDRSQHFFCRCTRNSPKLCMFTIFMLPLFYWLSAWNKDWLVWIGNFG